MIWLALLAWSGIARAGEEERLAKWQILTELKIQPGISVKEGISRGVVRASLEKVHGVITDYDHYAKFMPRTELSEVKERKPDQIRYFTKLDMPWPIEDVAYECEVKGNPSHRQIDFKMVEGTGMGVRDFRGSWELEPFQGKDDLTLVTYRLIFVPEREYPKWAVNIGNKVTIKGIIRAIRSRINRIDARTKR